ncbi:MAG TPA: phosphomannomutase [Woeseiaceae bacterium]|nr:phosphomannomutase [Woeseiaceae bacterium]
MPLKIECFKAYDIRGQIPNELNVDIAYRVGNALVEFLDAKTIVLGRDIRLTSPEFADAVSAGVREAGADVLDIGLGGTEMVYFATGELGADGGIMVTASHNPADYNGLKLVREEARPISGDTGLQEIRALAERDERRKGSREGERKSVDIADRYVSRLLSFIDRDALSRLRIVTNAGNGGAGLSLDRLEPHLPFEFVKVHHEADGRFPNGVPNPMLSENRKPTIDAITGSNAALGIAWDGDFDRCFFFDGNGRFIEGYYIVGLLAQSQLEAAGARPGGDGGPAIVYDPRLTWNTIEIVREHGGRPVQSKSGHSFMKETMRKENGLYGGEMSAHHYFRDFFYCDSGMIPWLLVAELVCKSGVPLAELVDDRMEKFPASGEINRKVADAQAAIRAIRDRYAPDANSVDETDGVSIEFDQWRFNLRASNTEPVIRLNVESRGDKKLMQEKVEEILALLDG